jgi:hypothetical protein
LCFLATALGATPDARGRRKRSGIGGAGSSPAPQWDCGYRSQIAYRFAGAAIKIPEMMRCAKELKLKARSIVTDWTHLKKLQLPAIAERKYGVFVILGEVD